MPLADDFLQFSPVELQTRLHIHRMIGKGGFACVYKAVFDEGVVALKVLKPEFCKRDSTDLKMFLREGQYLKRCKHRNIVSCLGLCQLPPDFPGLEGTYKNLTWAMILQYVEGGPLSKLVAKQHNNPNLVLYDDQKAFQWCMQIAESLSHLHTSIPQVIHRDVKLGNVLLSSRKDGRPECKLADFGLHVKVNPGEHKMLRRKYSLPSQVPEELFYSVDRHGVAHSLASRTGSTISGPGSLDLSRKITQDISNKRSDMSGNAVEGVMPSRRSTTARQQRQSLLLPNQPSRSDSPLAHRVLPSGHSTAAAAAAALQSELLLERQMSACEAGPHFSRNSNSPTLNPQVRISGGGALSGRQRAALFSEDSMSPMTPGNRERGPSIVKRRSAVGVPGQGSLTVRSRVQFSAPSMTEKAEEHGENDQSPAMRAASFMSTANSDLLDSIPDICILDRQKSVFRLMRSAVSPEFEREFQWVFNLTGRTGSHLYMAPEVYKMLPYNEKVDVYSFGVVVYELFSRSMLSLTQLSPHGPYHSSADYAQSVVNGFRPERHGDIHDEMWSLILTCWHEDPVQRPSMPEVLLRLKIMRKFFFPEEVPTEVPKTSWEPPPKEETITTEVPMKQGCRCIIS